MTTKLVNPRKAFLLSLALYLRWLSKFQYKYMTGLAKIFGSWEVETLYLPVIADSDVGTPTAAPSHANVSVHWFDSLLLIGAGGFGKERMLISEIPPCKLHRICTSCETKQEGYRMQYKCDCTVHAVWCDSVKIRTEYSWAFCSNIHPRCLRTACSHRSLC